MKHRHLHECTKCGHQVSPTAGTILEHTRLLLPKWFAVVNLMETDKRRISAERYSKMVGLACACRMLGELRLFTEDRDSGWLDRLAGVGDVFVGRHDSSASKVRTDAFSALLLDVSPRHEPKPTSHENLKEWLPKVHLPIRIERVVGREPFTKCHIATFRDNIVKFAFRFNRRFREPQLPKRLLQNADVTNQIYLTYN